MGNLVTAKVTIQGTRPILWHHFGPDAIPLEKKEKTGVAGNDPEEWRKTVTTTKDGQLYMDGSYAFATILGGAAYTKKGKGSIQKFVGATLQVLDDMIMVDRYLPEEPLPTDPTLPVYLDIRGVVNPTTKSRNVRYRVAASKGWTASFSIQWDKTVVSRQEMQAAIIDAGKLVGIANGRKIGYGRFDVSAFEVEDSN